ncbi:hypothetical protein QJQ45_029611, partial [Haematococcus lacustris]
WEHSATQRSLRGGAHTGYRAANLSGRDTESTSTTPRPTDVKEALAKKCTLKFHSSITDETVKFWYQRHRGAWPSPQGAFKDSAVRIFWDMENCRPEEEFGPLPINYSNMFRSAFKASTDARSLRCIASLSRTYPGTGQLALAKWEAMNSLVGFMSVLTAPGKTNEVVHKDLREADNVLICKMSAFQEECELGDVVVIVSGDGGFAPLALQFKDRGVSVIVIGPSLHGTNLELMEAADMWMDWRAFCQAQYKGQRSIPLELPPEASNAWDHLLQVEARTQSLMKSHVQQYSSVKNLDFVCLLDVTSSMQPHIEAVRNNIGAVLDQISSRFPWAKDHMRMACIGYRDFMANTPGKVETEPFVWDGGAGSLPSLGDPAQAHTSAERMRTFLSTVQGSGGGDAAEDVLGGLLKVAEMLERDGLGRNTVLFHICDYPNHGMEFNNFTDPLYDFYPNGPLKPVGNYGAVPPPGRSKPWKQEAEEVLTKLKTKLNVTKYVLVQLRKEHTAKMVDAFKALVSDPEEEAWTVRKAAGQQSSSEAGSQAAEEEPWIQPLDMDTASSAEEMSNNLVRMMVSTTLATITRLSLMVYDKEKGLAHRKSRVKGGGVAMPELLRVAEEAAAEMEAIDAEQACEQIQAAVNRGAQDLALGSEDTDHGQNSTGPGFDNSTSYKESILEKKFKDINRRIKNQVKHGAKAEEVSLMEPFDLVELIENIKDGELYQRATSVPNSKAEVPLLLTTETSTDPTYYFKVKDVMAEGAQRYVYEAVREVRGKVYIDNLVVMKEFIQSKKHGNTKFRYYQMMQGNVVANFLARLFNKECEEKGITEVHGHARCDLVYMPMWSATWDLPGGGKCNHNVEPYIVGKYLKYNSNSGAVNMATLNDICHAFSHWTYVRTEGLLMVTDVQGVKDHTERKILLTDPAVQCVPLIENYFDPESNRGAIGVKEFFLGHSCNDACRKLGLNPTMVRMFMCCAVACMQARRRGAAGAARTGIGRKAARPMRQAPGLGCRHMSASHITVTLATWDAVWEVCLDPKWARQRLRMYGAQDRALEQFFKKLEKDMAEVSLERHGHAKQLVVFFGAASIGTAGGWGADAVLRACCKVVCRPRGAGQRRGRVVLVDEHRTTRVSSAVNGQQPCEEELNKLSATRPAGWKPPAGQVEQRLVRPAWSQQRDQPVRGLMWCPVVAPRKPPQAPRSSQSATHPAASEPGPSTPQPAKRSKLTEAELAAEPTQPTTGKGKGKGKAAKAKPVPQPGRWLDRDCNAALNMQRIGESRWQPLEL